MEQTPLNRPNIIQREPQFFQAQLGIRGSDSTLGWRNHPDAIVLYVDSGHALASDNNIGTDPQAPLATVQAAVDHNMLTSYSEIRVSGTVAEDVVTPDYATGPNYVWLRGQGVSSYSPAWEGDDAATASLDLRGVGWRITGFRFYGKTTAAAIELRHTDSGANDIAIRTVIANCLLDGLTTGRYGIHTHGCYDVWIVNCMFQLWHNAVGGGAVPLYANITPLALPYRNHVIGCQFWDNDNGAIFPCNGSEFHGNIFQKVGYAYTSAEVLQTNTAGAGGDDNVVCKNHLPAAYTVAGGYRGGPADDCAGNFSPNIAHASVADNGWTVALPI